MTTQRIWNVPHRAWEFAERLESREILERYLVLATEHYAPVAAIDVAYTDYDPTFHDEQMTLTAWVYKGGRVGCDVDFEWTALVRETFSPKFYSRITPNSLRAEDRMTSSTDIAGHLAQSHKSGQNTHPSTPARVQVAISPAVASRITAVRLEAEFDEVLNKIPEMFPQAHRIECEFDPGIPDEEDPIVIVNTWIPDDGQAYPTPTDRWTDWTIHRFPGAVLAHFVVLFWHEAV